MHAYSGEGVLHSSAFIFSSASSIWPQAHVTWHKVFYFKYILCTCSTSLSSWKAHYSTSSRSCLLFKKLFTNINFGPGLFLIDHIHMYSLPSTHWLGYKRMEAKVEVASWSASYIQISAKAAHKNLNHFGYDNHESLAAITSTLLCGCFYLTAPNRNKISELRFTVSRTAYCKKGMQNQK